MPEINTNFTLDIAKSLYFADDQFPVDFDVAWEWLGYSRKDNAKSNFSKCGFVHNMDYQLHQSQELRPQGGFSNREIIRLTVDCFKHWAMMAGTEKGKQVRLYFLECEKIAKQNSLPKNYLEALKALVSAEEDKLRLEAEKLELKAVNEKLEDVIEEQHTLVMIGEMFLKFDKNMSVSEFAKAYKAIGGRNKTYEFLREIKFLCKHPSREPYQTHINTKRATTYLKPRNNDPTKFDLVPLITPKGAEWIIQQHQDYLKGIVVEQQMEEVVQLTDY